MECLWVEVVLFVMVGVARFSSSSFFLSDEIDFNEYILYIMGDTARAGFRNIHNQSTFAVFPFSSPSLKIPV